MFSKSHREMMRPSYAAILEALKRSDGMPISDLARELKMSYMGIKQHCLNLVEMGYLREWRVPREKKEVGRPEKLYQLTNQCDELFPVAGVALSLAILEGVKSLYGESAPEKLLLQHFQNLQNQWTPKIRAGKSLVEKATRLSDLRDQHGWFSRCHYDPEIGFRIEEFHNPLTPVYTSYPNAVRMEVQMMEKLLGTKIDRSEVSTGKGRRRIVFKIATLGVHSEEKEAPKQIPIPDISEMGDLFKGL